MQNLFTFRCAHLRDMDLLNTSRYNVVPMYQANYLCIFLFSNCLKGDNYLCFLIIQGDIEKQMSTTFEPPRATTSHKRPLIYLN